MANGFIEKNQKFLGLLLLGVGAYQVVLKPILQKLNIQETAEEKKERLKKEAAEVVTESGGSSSPYSWSAFFQEAPKGVLIMSDVSALAFAKKIKEADFWAGWFQYDEKIPFGVLSGLKTQSQFSWICRKFYLTYSISMLEFLKEKLTNSEFSDFNVKLVSKPKYK
jgi:hypothetical protein